MKSHLFALPFLLALLGASCDPQPETSSSTGKHAIEFAPATAPIPPVPPSTQPSPADPAKAPPQTSPILVVPLSKAASTSLVAASHDGATDTVNYACKTSADCAVKDVGNCCGQYPACVNKGSRTFPDQVRAQCKREHRMGVCGFPSISGCECVAGKCSSQTGTTANPIAQ